MVKAPGFMLIEVLITLSLVLLLAGLSFGSMHFFSRNVSSDIGLLYQYCLFAQRRAISSGSSCSVLIDTQKHSYTCEGSTIQLSDGVRFGFCPHAKGPPSSPHQRISKACTFANNQIVCSPEGTIDAGTVYITDAKGASMYALTSGVDAVSYLRLYRYDGSWKRLQS